MFTALRPLRCTPEGVPASYYDKRTLHGSPKKCFLLHFLLNFLSGVKNKSILQLTVFLALTQVLHGFF